MDHTLLARIEMLRAEIVVIQMYVEGMKAANADRLANNDAICYHEESFASKASEVRNIINQLHALTY